MSVATENFLKVIYNFEQHEGWDTKPGSIAKALGITNAAATDMARKLSLKKLLDYEKYKKLKLTPSGEKMALSVIRKHRLWESFLHKVFGLSLHEIHREAESLEHFTSDFLADKISEFLNNPTTDPHGDPIPDENGNIPFDENNFPLTMAEAGCDYEICRLKGFEKEFFDFCLSNELLVGHSITIKKRYTNTGMIEIEKEGVKLLLNDDLTKTIHVKKLKSE